MAACVALSRIPIRRYSPYRFSVESAKINNVGRNYALTCVIASGATRISTTKSDGLGELANAGGPLSQLHCVTLWRPIEP
jgi:hypothetical protein